MEERTLIYREHSALIFDSNSTPYGIDYSKWTKLWWRWLVSIPKETNPASDNSGKYCSMSQNNQNVWFLAGSFDDCVRRFKRNCAIPYGKAILFPVINYQSSFSDQPSAKKEMMLERQCKNEIDIISEMHVSLDDQIIDVQKYRVRSGCFRVNMPTDNCLDIEPGMTTIASEGYWLFLRPLPVGKHVLSSFGSCRLGKIKIGGTYNLVIDDTSPFDHY